MKFYVGLDIVSTLTEQLIHLLMYDNILNRVDICFDGIDLPFFGVDLDFDIECAGLDGVDLPFLGVDGFYYFQIIKVLNNHWNIKMILIVHIFQNGLFKIWTMN
ncbi:hypothetical protein ACTFIV_002921 [Dictyostelium citrinum]